MRRVAMTSRRLVQVESIGAGGKATAQSSRRAALAPPAHAPTLRMALRRGSRSISHNVSVIGDILAETQTAS